MKKFVSIIIPTYNEETFLEKTILSIKNQDYYGKYEIIISDGQSEDNTLKIARKYKAKIVTSERRSIAVQRNAGAKAAKGNILLFVDADTILMPNTVSEFAKSFSKKKIIGVTCPVFPSRPTVKNLAIYLSFNQIVKLSTMSIRAQAGAICVAFRKKDFFYVNGFNENIHALEDIDLSIRISKFGKIFYCEKTLVVTSPRRVEKWGHIKSFGKYLHLYLKYLSKWKISQNDYLPVRH